MTEYLITPMSADSGINSHSTVAGSEDVYNCTAHGNNPVSPSETYSTGFKDSRSTSRSARKSDAVPYKPTVPYAQLISQAIDSKPDHKITLNEIYNFAMHTYEYFKSAGNGWKVASN